MIPRAERLYQKTNKTKAEHPGGGSIQYPQFLIGSHKCLETSEDGNSRVVDYINHQGTINSRLSNLLYGQVIWR